MIGEIIIGIIGASGILITGLKYLKVIRIVKEVAELVGVSAAAMEDGKLTDEEMRKIWKELQDVISIFAKPVKKAES